MGRPERKAKELDFKWAKYNSKSTRAVMIAVDIK